MPPHSCRTEVKDSMYSYLKLISVVAQSDMARDALSHWSVFKVPQPDKRIDDLMAKLALEPKGQPKS